jgi:hypothetical protein
VGLVQHCATPRGWRGQSRDRGPKLGLADLVDEAEGKRASGKLLERGSADPRQCGGIGGAMATRKSNVINFPQPINPERKDDVRMAEQFFEKIDGLVMEGLRRDLAAAEARALTADADAACGGC